MNDQKEREVIELTAPSGKKLKVKSYITARERNEIRSVILPSMSLDMTNNKVVDNVSADVLAKAEPKLIEVIVAEYDGSSENILDRMLDGSPADYDFIIGQLKEINDGTLTLAE